MPQPPSCNFIRYRRNMRRNRRPSGRAPEPFMDAAEGLIGTMHDNIGWLAVFDAGLYIGVGRVDEAA
jgi:hypothetical protein